MSISEAVQGCFESGSVKADNGFTDKKMLGLKIFIHRVYRSKI
jgi:hypothetical protein